MCAISVFNCLLSIIILWVGWVECRICKWKLLSVDRSFVAAFAQLTSFRDVGSSFLYTPSVHHWWRLYVSVQLFYPFLLWSRSIKLQVWRYFCLWVIISSILWVISCLLVEAFYVPLWYYLLFGILAYSNFSPYTGQRQCVSVKQTNATGLTYEATELFNYGYQCYFSHFRHYW